MSAQVISLNTHRVAYTTGQRIRRQRKHEQLWLEVQLHRFERELAAAFDEMIRNDEEFQATAGLL